MHKIPDARLQVLCFACRVLLCFSHTRVFLRAGVCLFRGDRCAQRVRKANVRVLPDDTSVSLSAHLCVSQRARVYVRLAGKSESVLGCRWLRVPAGWPVAKDLCKTTTYCFTITCAGVRVVCGVLSAPTCPPFAKTVICCFAPQTSGSLLHGRGLSEHACVMGKTQLRRGQFARNTNCARTRCRYATFVARVGLRFCCARASFPA